MILSRLAQPLGGFRGSRFYGLVSDSLIFLLLVKLLSVFFYFALDSISPLPATVANTSQILSRDGFWTSFFVVVIAGPFIETLLFQWGGLWLLGLLPIQQETRHFALSLLFALYHSFDITSLVYTFGSGYVLTRAYFILKTNVEPGIRSVYFLHLLSNQVVLIFALVLS